MYRPPGVTQTACGLPPTRCLPSLQNVFCTSLTNLIKRRSLKVADRNAYVAAYSRPGRMRAGWAYFAAWPDTAKDFAQMAKTRLTMPVLSIAGEKASAAILGPQM